MRRTLGVTSLVLALASGACRSVSPPELAASRDVEPRGKLLLIGLDGADWKILDRLAAAGRVPTIDRLRREGAAGVLRSEEPLLSPIVWTTIGTGRTPLEHGITGFLTIRDGKTEPVRSDERRLRAFWNVASDFGVRVRCAVMISTLDSPANGGAPVNSSNARQPNA